MFPTYYVILNIQLSYHIILNIQRVEVMFPSNYINKIHLLVCRIWERECGQECVCEKEKKRERVYVFIQPLQDLEHRSSNTSP